MTSLAWAAGRGHTEIVQMLLNKGAKVNTPDKVRAVLYVVLSFFLIPRNDDKVD